MPVSRKLLVYVFVALLAGAYCLWLTASADNPLWGDELITVALVKSVALRHLFSAVLLGLDATPPLYTGYGWFMLHYVIPGARPELLLRITNAGLIGATLSVLYLLVRRYFDQMTALTTIGVFILLELPQLKFLTLEIRTYAALVFFTTLTIYAALRAIARPYWFSLTCTMIACCLLVSSHTFGIIYAVTIVGCMVVATAAGGNIRLALNSSLTAVPALVMFFLWIPVLHHQAALGSWIPRPDFGLLLASSYAPANKLQLVMVLLLLAAATLLRRRFQNRKSPILTQWWRSINPVQTFAMLLPVAFCANTLAIWLFSRLVFPTFIPRYFFPNVVLHVIWLSVVVNFFFTHLTPSSTKYGLVLVSAVLASVSIRYRELDPESRIPCFDSSRRAYLEDPFKDDGRIVVLSSHPWLTRLHRRGETVVFPLEEGALRKNGAEYPPYVYDTRFVTRFAKWLGVNAVMTTSRLLDTKPDFLVLDDRSGPWLEYVQLHYKVKLTSLAEMKGCTLWRVKVLE